MKILIYGTSCTIDQYFHFLCTVHAELHVLMSDLVYEFGIIHQVLMLAEEQAGEGHYLKLVADVATRGDSDSLHQWLPHSFSRSNARIVNRVIN